MAETVAAVVVPAATVVDVASDSVLGDVGGGAPPIVVVGVTESAVRCELTATGCSAGPHEASRSAPMHATTVSDRIRRNGTRPGAGTAARYRAAESHEPRQIAS